MIFPFKYTCMYVNMYDLARFPLQTQFGFIYMLRDILFITKQAKTLTLRMQNVDYGKRKLYWEKLLFFTEEKINKTVEK